MNELKGKYEGGSQLQDRKQRVRLWWYRHRYLKYIVVFVVFFIFTALLGDASLFRQYKFSKRISGLERELKITSERYKQDSVRLQEIRSDRDGIEHIAREEFLMKAPGEMIFIIADTSATLTTQTIIEE